MNFDETRDLFWQFQRQGLFTDVTLSIGDSVYNCHKIILAATTGFFKNLLTSGFNESLPFTTVINLGVDDPAGIFENVLKYIYSGNISWVTPTNALATYHLATYFGLQGLCDAANNIFKNTSVMTPERIIDQILSSGSSFVPDSAIGCIASKFNQLTESDSLLQLPIGVLSRVVKSPDLRIRSDGDIVNVLSRYHNIHKLSDAHLKLLGKAIHWQLLSPTEWETLDWRPFITENFANRVQQGVQAARAANPKFWRLQLVLNSPNIQTAVQRLTKYVPPRVHYFKLTEDFFTQPVAFHRVGHMFSMTRLEQTLEMAKGYGVFLSEMRFSWKGNVQIVTIKSEPVGLRTERVETALIHGENHVKVNLRDRELMQKVTIIFTVADTRGFRLVSAKAEGFTAPLEEE